MRLFKLLLPVVLLFSSYSVAVACSCLRGTPPCEAYGYTDVIFLGRVIGSAQQKTAVESKGNKVVYDVGTIRFLVQENFKGAEGYEVEIHSGTGGGDCGYWFLRNESYVVYAYRNSEGKLGTNICTRTALAMHASEDLEFLRGLSKASAGGTLSGELTRLIGDPEHGPVQEGPKMAGIKINVTGAGRSFETLTDKEGKFSLTGLSPGDYDAFPELPDKLAAVSNRDKEDNFGRFTHREPIKVVDRGCSRVRFMVQFNGSVSGKVTDANGEPAKEVQVNLVPGDDADKYWYTWTDKDGYYEFRMVQPGSYLLGFNLKWAPDKDDPYSKTYYPNVKTRSEAAMITVGEGERLKGYDMALPTRLSERQLQVTVVGADGKPATDVEVRFEINEASSLGQTVKTDEKGIATVTLFANHYYIIGADAERNNKPVHAQPVEVFADEKLKPLKLVLNKPGYGYEEKDALKRKPPQ